MTKLMNQPNANHESKVLFVRPNTKTYLEKWQKKNENNKIFILTLALAHNFTFVKFGVGKQKQIDSS